MCQQMTFNIKDMQEKKKHPTGQRWLRDFISPHGLCPQSCLQALYGFVPLVLVLLLHSKENLSLLRKEEKTIRFGGLCIRAWKKKKASWFVTSKKWTMLVQFPIRYLVELFTEFTFILKETRCYACFLLAHFCLNCRLVQESFKMNNL